MEVEVILVDLFDELSLAGALAKLKSITTQSATKKKITDVKVIICGGDGTVLWVVS